MVLEGSGRGHFEQRPASFVEGVSERTSRSQPRQSRLVSGGIEKQGRRAEEFPPLSSSPSSSSSSASEPTLEKNRRRRVLLLLLLLLSSFQWSGSTNKLPLLTSNQLPPLVFSSLLFFPFLLSRVHQPSAILPLATAKETSGHRDNRAHGIYVGTARAQTNPLANDEQPCPRRKRAISLSFECPPASLLSRRLCLLLEREREAFRVSGTSTGPVECSSQPGFCLFVTWNELPPLETSLGLMEDIFIGRRTAKIVYCYWYGIRGNTESIKWWFLSFWRDFQEMEQLISFWNGKQASFCWAWSTCALYLQRFKGRSLSM